MSETVRSQWGRLIALTTAHFVLDMFPGLMHTILPAVQRSFSLSVAAGGVLLSVFLVGSNAIQVLIGHVRENEDRPLLLYIGLLLTCTILLFGVVSAQRAALVWLSVIALVCGMGVGMTHPESLRAIHRLEGISSSVSSAVFMGGGVLGFAFGSVSSTHLFARWGCRTIPFCAAFVTAVVLMLGIRLAVERTSKRLSPSDSPKTGERVRFVVVLLIAAIVSSVQLLVDCPAAYQRDRGGLDPRRQNGLFVYAGRRSRGNGPGAFWRSAGRIKPGDFDVGRGYSVCAGLCSAATVCRLGGAAQCGRVFLLWGVSDYGQYRPQQQGAQSGPSHGFGGRRHLAGSVCAADGTGAAGRACRNRRGDIFVAGRLYVGVGIGGCGRGENTQTQNRKQR